MINNYLLTITVIDKKFFSDYDPPSYTSRDDDDDDEDDQKSCFKLPKNRVCYSLYIYWYPKFCDKFLMGLEQFEVGKNLSLNSQSLGIY